MEGELTEGTGDIEEWINCLTLAKKKAEKEWWRKAKKVVERYRDERQAQLNNEKKLNILWSNTETLKPALYANSPKPEVSRRFKDADPAGRVASEILERALSYSIDSYDFDDEIRSCIEDYLLPGMATVRVMYKPTYGDEITPRTALMQTEFGYLDDTGAPVPEEMMENIISDETGVYLNGEPYKPVVYEEATCSYVFWKDFLCGQAKRWRDVPWVAFAAYMDRDELVSRFGSEVGNRIPLDCKVEDDKNELDSKEYNMYDKAQIWEVWDKKNRVVRWISMTYKNDFLDVSEPPLDFRNFWPCPKPIMSVSTNDTMTPIPEFCMYQDQADEIDVLTMRIAKLVPQIKLAGAYPSEGKSDVGRILTEGLENRLIPVDEWAMFAERGGIAGSISWLPLDQVVTAVTRLYEAREQTKQELYEITGISDIIRGASNAAETATAQRIKGQFATLRLSDRQAIVSGFVRDVLRLKAEVIAENFSAQTLGMMTGIYPDESVMQLLRSDVMRGFRIDIETDSTLMADEEMDKRSRIEFLESVTGFIGSLMPMFQENPAIGPLLGEMIMFGVRGFKAGRQLEGAIENAIQAMQQQAQQAQSQPPQPDPRQIEAQTRAQKVQQDMQLDQAKFQHESNLDKAKFQQEQSMDKAEFELKVQQANQDAELELIKARLKGI